MKQGGFTLIEVLVAMALLALLSVIAWQGLNTALDSGQQFKRHADRWRDVAAFFWHIQEDSVFLLPQSSRDGLGHVHGALETEADGNGSGAVWMTRGEPDGAPPRRVGYRLRDGHILWEEWPAVDTGNPAQITEQPVLDNVKRWHWQFLTQSDQWVTIWPLSARADELPRAIRVDLQLVSGEQVFRVFALP